MRQPYTLGKRLRFSPRENGFVPTTAFTWRGLMAADPQRLPDGGHAGKDEVVMVGVGDVGGGHNLAVGEKSAAKIVDLYENGWHNSLITRYV